MTLRAYIEKLIRPVPPSRRRDRSRHHEQHPKPWAKPWLERLEDRLAPANLVVLNSNDSGAASLRQAILSSGPGDSISFSPDLAGQTITLTSGVLTITHSLSINGLGADQLTVSGNNASSVFSITSGNVTLSGLMITGGKTAFSGGGVQISTTGITTLVGDDIEFNTAGSYGGGVLLKSPLNSQATLTITNSTIANNSAARSGAGIEVLDTSATITNSTIANNQLTASAPVGGAGVDVLAFGAGASILLESDTLSGNLVATKSESADLAVDAAIGNGNFTATAILHR